MPLKDLAEVKSKIYLMKIIPKVGDEDLSEIWKILLKLTKLVLNTDHWLATSSKISATISFIFFPTQSALQDIRITHLSTFVLFFKT